MHTPTHTHSHTHKHKQHKHKQHKHKQHTHLRNGLGERACSIEHVQELLCFGNMGLLPNKNQNAVLRDGCGGTASHAKMMPR